MTTINNPTGAARNIATGTYTGNGAAARQITTGFQCSYVFITRRGNASGQAQAESLIPNGGVTHSRASPYHWDAVGDSLHASNGFIVGLDTVKDCNVNAIVYDYWAIEV